MLRERQRTWAITIPNRIWPMIGRLSQVDMISLRPPMIRKDVPTNINAQFCPTSTASPTTRAGTAELDLGCAGLIIDAGHRCRPILTVEPFIRGETSMPPDGNECEWRIANLWRLAWSGPSAMISFLSYTRYGQQLREVAHGAQLICATTSFCQ